MQIDPALSSGDLPKMLENTLALIQSLRIRHAKDGGGIGLGGLQLKSEGNSEMTKVVSSQPLHRCDASAECLSIQRQVTLLENIACQYQSLMEVGQKWIYTEGHLVALPRDTMDTELAR